MEGEKPGNLKHKVQKKGKSIKARCSGTVVGSLKRLVKESGLERGKHSV